MTQKELDLIETAEKRGGKFLGIVNNKNSRHKKYIWKCDKGHTWHAREDSIMRGTWCPTCSHNKQRHTIEDMQSIAKKRGGVCLSQEYINSKAKLKWQCNDGHIFEATPSKILMGRWCRACGNKLAASKRRISFEEIQKIAEVRKGKCLSNGYDPKRKLEWQCEFGHTWRASIHNIKKGSWCPVCTKGKGGKKPLSLKEFQQIAISRGGKCLSRTYKNTDTKLKWMCRNGHIWMAIPSSIKKGSWCPVCAGNAMLDLEQAQSVAENRGGICLSKEYKGVHYYLKWQCAEGHIWTAKLANISNGKWCPECSTGIGERICRAYFEQLFNKNFPKTRPTWLINDDGYQMELDGYCEKLSLAFEHQGRQHFEQNKFFHASKKQFDKRKKDDRRKKELCKKHNVILIDVPQIPDALSLEKIESFIIKECSDKGIKVPKHAKKLVVSLREAYSPSSNDRLKELQDIASEQGGSCLSDKYLGTKIKLRFSCKHGHEWETIPNVVLKGHWCPICSRSNQSKSRRLTIDEMNQLAEMRGGLCLSAEYVNANTYLLWQCEKGHTWKAIPNSIKRGSWCPTCHKEKRLLEN